MIKATDVCLGYGDQQIIHSVSCRIPSRAVTVIVGPNGCGKSTLLKGIARQLPLRSGTVTCQDQSIAAYDKRSFARTLAFLPQKNRSPEGVTVRQLVGLGRYPYQSLFQRTSQEDIDKTAYAMDVCHVTHLAERPVAQLSGGQQQKAWLAMIVAQDTGVLLLDEPTSALDLGHQMDVANLIKGFALAGKTIVVVLHDWYLASLIADHLLVLHEGKLLTSGAPREVITSELIATLYGIPSRIMADPDNGVPIVLRRIKSGASELGNPLEWVKFRQPQQ